MHHQQLQRIVSSEDNVKGMNAAFCEKAVLAENAVFACLETTGAASSA